MRNKVKSLILVSGLLVLGIGVSACGYSTTEGDGIVDIPHAIDWGFTNCLVCHSDAALDSISAPHAQLTLDTCAIPACHLPLDYIPPTLTSTPTDTTTITLSPTSTIVVPQGPLTPEAHSTLGDSTILCMLCHMPEGPEPNPEDHLDYTNESCFDTDCHLPSE